MAFLICESVIHDAETQKKTLVGLFDRLQSTVAPTPAVPIVINGLGLYAKMVEGDGSYTFKVRMVNLKDESHLLEISAQANWQLAEAPLEFGANLRGIPIQAFGNYEFQLFANDIYLGRAVFRVDKLELPLPSPPGRG